MRSRVSRLLRVLGPGLITGASDDDPSGIATYSQAGAKFGFAITWTMLFTYPLMCVVQEISGRIGRTTGIGIAGNLRKHYPNWLLQSIVGALFIANTINIGADLGAMADVSLLIGGPHLVFVLAFGIFCAVLQIVTQYARYVAVLKWLTLALFAYFGTVMAVKIPWGEAAAGSFCRRFLVTSNFGPQSLPSSVRRSAPICSFGRPRKKQRTRRRSRNASRSSERQVKAPTRSSASGSTPMSEWPSPTSLRSPSW